MLNFKRYMRENPIVTRLLGLIILSSSVITLLAILLQLHGNFNDDVAELEKRVDQVRISTLASITKSLWGFDQEQLNIQIHSVLDVDDVVQVSVTWHDWNNIEQHLVASNPGYSPRELELKPAQFLVRDYPLIYEDANTPPQPLGVLRVTVSLASIYDKLWQRGSFVALVQGAKTLVIALFIIWLVHTLLTRHIKAIAQYARNLNLESLTKPLKLKRLKLDSLPDELDNVVNAINQMRETLLDDIEQRHAIELALLSEKEEKLETRRQKNAAEDASRAKSQFLATMSHEIRTPMNGVIGMLEMLCDTPLDENQKHYVEVIHRSGETLLSIINDILDYSKIEAGKMQLEETRFDLEELIDSCIQLFGATANKQRIELFGGLAPGVPSLLRGDPTRLRQIIINLLSNAFKFTEEGHVSLEVSIDQLGEPAQPGRIGLRFVVQDSGIGIDPGTAGQLFDSFNQGDASTTRKYGGTGLGLAICKSLAELMGGHIGVNSVKGEGAQFWFTAQFDAQLPLSPLNPGARTLLGKRLLMVEASEPLLHYLRRYCETWGLQLDSALSAGRAMEKLSQAQQSGEAVDFIVIDQSLPDASGVELVQWLRDSPALVQLPVLMLSSGDAYHDQVLMQRLGIRAVIRKPLAAKMLYRELAALLGLLPAPQLPALVAAQQRDKFSHLRVLVAEDNPVNRMVIRGLLGKLGIVPTLTENGREALEFIASEQQSVDIILMDCEMPEMDGFEATRAIRQWEAERGHSAIPIVALTAHALQEHRDAVFASGMDYYLAKPITFDALYSALDALDIVK